MGLLCMKKGKWIEVPEWGDKEWNAFARAAKAQAALDDAIAYAADGMLAVEDIAVLDMQCWQRKKMSLSHYYNDCRKAGRAEFLIAAKESAEHSAGLAAWFGDKAAGIADTTPDAQPVTVLVDV